MTDQYKLEGKTAIPCNDLLEWGRWIEKANRRVAEDYIGKPVNINELKNRIDNVLEKV